VAKKEFEAYVQLLRELELDVIEMPQDEELPESVFIEDAAVVCNNIALITKPGSSTRQKEVSDERKFGEKFAR
jgi:dimethylargininase